MCQPGFRRKEPQKRFAEIETLTGKKSEWLGYLQQENGRSDQIPLADLSYDLLYQLLVRLLI